MNRTETARSRASEWFCLGTLDRVGPMSAKLVLLICLIWVISGPALSGPAVESDSDVATAGFFRLTWKSDLTSADYELQEATRGDFSDARVLYRGPDVATVLSGKPDGDYYYRVGVADADVDSAWSESVHVSVRSHPLSRALIFLVLGAVVFLATVLLILRGEARTRSPRRGPP